MDGHGANLKCENQAVPQWPGLWRPFGSLTFPVPGLPRNGEHSIATGISSMSKPQSLHDCLDPKFTKFILNLACVFEVVVQIYIPICLCCCICWSCYCFVVVLLSLSLSSSLFGAWNKRGWKSLEASSSKAPWQVNLGKQIHFRIFVLQLPRKHPHFTLSVWQ